MNQRTDWDNLFCSFEGCYNRTYSGGLCYGHVWQMRRGDLGAHPLKKQKTEPWDVPACAFEGCESPSYDTAYCDPHGQQIKKGQALSPIQARKRAKLPDGTFAQCSFEGCDNPSRSIGLCRTHYSQHYSGKELHPIKQEIPCPVPECRGSYTAKSRIKCCPWHVQKGRRYNLTVAELIELFTEAKCAMCGSRDALHVDHDHACCPTRGTSCGKCVRGLLCKDCNTLLGHARDSTAILGAAITYLETRGLRAA
ncbi:endonuclease VII domain-containing protein [Microbacterium sp. zg-YB36]|uniref:endonuclease VII domain-containing protein n=1 Tax=Microbacterium sp. zg-YB36 TaxID=2969407 RepID=UPI00214D0988|nr:endonuclease VII domain-containing protein [Microbacterium sp. zg-YB36]MDL5351098.1 endonuclease VII domain-containing protein [Microbacterium sp. zg-YB36]